MPMSASTEPSIWDETASSARTVRRGTRRASTDPRRSKGDSAMSFVASMHTGASIGGGDHR
jgi:hypothetical protein